MATSTFIELTQIQRIFFSTFFACIEFRQATNQLLSIFDMGSNTIDRIASKDISKEMFDTQAIFTIFQNILQYPQTKTLFPNANKRNVSELKLKFSNLKQRCETFVTTNEVFIQTIGIIPLERESAEDCKRIANYILNVSSRLHSLLEGLLTTNILSD